jgi:ribosomal protein S12 methylthiotransferase
VVIVNTCGFIQEAKEQSIETILEACELKATARSRRSWRWGASSSATAPSWAEIPEVDLFLGLTELPGLVPELRARGLPARRRTSGSRHGAAAPHPLHRRRRTRRI